ncbi:MAG TPA: chorismate synthase [Saprospiraceae bacterium]|nr:chorismate synthase [Saprospiraceae bacterium]
MGNTFGKIFRITTYGESHGPAIGAVIDGCPAGLAVDEEFIAHQMERRRPGQSAIVTQRKEADAVEILSGVFENKTTGMPIHLMIRNDDAKSADYAHLADTFRPSHADYTYHAKYGHRDYRGGGRSSARETAARVAAGAFASMLLHHFNIDITAFVSQVGPIAIDPLDPNLDLSSIDNNVVRCPDATAAEAMEELIRQVRKEGDTIGGRISCLITGVPVGLGEPVFDKLQADLAAAMMGIQAVKGFEYGSGFGAITMRGSEHNDAFVKSEDKIATATNFSGGIQGGISNGMPIYFNVAFKPVATIVAAQATINTSGEETSVAGKGRHDPCVVPRAVPIVEAMAALTLADHLLRQEAYKHLKI